MPRFPRAALLAASLCAACGGGVPILMYHSVGQGRDPLTVTPEELESHLDWLSGAGYATVTLREMLDAQDGRGKLPANAVVLTFDDGYHDAFTEVLPRLAARGQRATFFIVSGFTAQDGAPRFSQHTRQFLTWPEVRALRDAGMEIGSHTVRHGRLTHLGRKELRAELEDSKRSLEAGLAARVEFFAYPFGEQQRWIRRAVERAGYRGAVMGARGNTDRLTLQRVTMHRGITPQDLRAMLAETWETAYTSGR